MRIMFDVDGVLADFVAGFKDAARAAGVTLKAQIPTVYNMENMVTREENSKIWKWIRQCNDFWFNLPLDPIATDASIQMGKLRQNGHEIIIISNRSDTGYTDAYSQTERWLKKYNIPFDKLILSANKGVVCRMERIDIGIDDYWINLDDMRQCGVKCIVMNQSYNRDIGNYDGRVCTIEEFVDLCLRKQN